MDYDLDRVLGFWEEDRAELRHLREKALWEERILYTYAVQLQTDARALQNLCDQLDQLTVRLSSTATEGV